MAEGNGGGGGGGGCGDSSATAGVRVEAASSSETPVFSGRTPRQKMTFEQCTQGIATALKDPTVKFMMEKMEKAGCQVFPGFIMSAKCNFSGFYSRGYGIEICCNNMYFQDHITQTLVHELIHAYDDCVGKNMNWKNCAHHACTEIRANRLAGNCHYKYEMMRGFMKIKGHEPECVKRRALESVEANPNCSKTAAKNALESVWNICYNDTRPFDRAP